MLLSWFPLYKIIRFCFVIFRALKTKKNSLWNYCMHTECWFIFLYSLRSYYKAKWEWLKKWWIILNQLTVNKNLVVIPSNLSINYLKLRWSSSQRWSAMHYLFSWLIIKNPKCYSLEKVSESFRFQTIFVWSTDSTKINRPGHNIRMYWRNFRQPTAHLQNIFGKTPK